LQLRTAHDVGHLFADGRRRLGWTQSQLAEVIGASRQWVSFVENGKTSVPFDLVLSALRAMGYTMHVEYSPRSATSDDSGRQPPGTTHEPTGRTVLTSRGERLDRRRRKRKADT
jgi:transcriptional regulator with XRE-family HTH domain